MALLLKLAGCCSLVLLGIVLTTNPQSLPSVLLIVPFVLLFLIAFLLLLFVGLRRGLARGRAGRVAAFSAALPVFILVLQSLGQLTPRDVLTILFLFGIAYLYMARAMNSSQA